MANHFILHENVLFDGAYIIGSFCEIGVPARGHTSGAWATHFGDHCTIRSHTIIYAGNEIGHHFQTGHGVLIRERNDIGNHVSVGSHTVIEHHVTIEDNVRIHSQAFVPEYTHLKEGCWLGPNVVLTNARHPLAPNVKQNLAGPIIGRGAKIGANVTILPGIHIGEMALIGAGAVVTADVPARAVVVGNPAKIIKYVDELTDPQNNTLYGESYTTYHPPKS